MQHLAVHTPRSRLCRGRCVCRAHSTPPLPPRHPISFPPRRFIPALPIPSSLFFAGAIWTFSSKGTTHGVALVSVPLLKSVSDCDLETVGSPCLLCEVRTARTGVLIRLNSTHVGCSRDFCTLRRLNAPPGVAGWLCSSSRCATRRRRPREGRRARAAARSRVGPPESVTPAAPSEPEQR